MPNLRFYLFGTFAAVRGDEAIGGLTSPKIRGLLAYLLLEPPITHERETIATLLWPDLPTRKSQQNLRQSLSRLQRAIGSEHDELLHISRQTIGRNPDSPVRVDALRFRSLLHRVRHHSHVTLHQCSHCVNHLTQLAALYRGDLALIHSDSAEFEAWELLQREWFRREVLQVLFTLAEHYEWLQDFEQMYVMAWRQTEIDPLREAAHLQVIRALAGSGRFEDAKGQYEILRTLLESELGAEPGTESVALLQQIVAQSTRPHQSIPIVASKTSVFEFALPTQVTPFIGREQEISLIIERLHTDNCRLLTLVGVGGAGKTRLAVQVAHQTIDDWGDGVYFVPLAAVNSVSDVTAMIANVLQVSFPQEAQSDEARLRILTDFLYDKQVLLILDNYEHLLPDTTLITTLVEKTPSVMWLVTSRQPLHLHAEWIVDIEGLSYPPSDRQHEPVNADNSIYESVQLFARLAQRVRATFTLTADTISIVSQICRVVVGMPLALELAVSHLRNHPLPDIAKEIAQTLDFLGTSMQDVPPRHRSLKAVFLHSWASLTEEEQVVLMHIALFRGGFTLESAEAVVGSAEGGRSPMVPIEKTLFALADKSLVRQSDSHRYELHELIRQYALEQLEQTAWVAVARERFTHYFGTFVETHTHALRSAGAVQALARFRQESENIRAAWYRAIEQQQWGVIRKAYQGVARYYEINNLFTEGAGLFDAVTSVLAMHPDVQELPLRVELVATQAHFYNLLTRHTHAISLLESVESLVPRVPLNQLTGAFTLRYAHGLLRQGYIHEPLPYLEQTIEHATSMNNPIILSEALYSVAQCLQLEGDFEAAQARYTEALENYEEMEDAWGQANVLQKLGAVNHYCARYEKARAYYRRALAWYRELQDQRGEAAVYSNFGAGYLDEAQYDRARDYLGRSLALRRTIGDERGIGMSLLNIGNLETMAGNFTTAEQVFEEAASRFHRSGNLRGEGTALTFQGYAVICQHRSAGAERILQNAVQATEAVNSLGFAALARYRLAQIAWSRGNLNEMLPILETVLESARTNSFSYLIWDVLADLGLLYQEAGDPRKALDFSREAVEQAEQSQNPSVHAYAYTRRGDVLRLQGNLDAIELYQKALDLRQSLNQPHFAMEIRAGLAEIYYKQGNQARAKQHVDAILEQAHRHQLQGTLRPVPIYLVCYTILQKIDPDRATLALSLAREWLEQQANFIVDDTERQRFLHDVPSHKAILAISI